MFEEQLQKPTDYIKFLKGLSNIKKIFGKMELHNFLQHIFESLAYISEDIFGNQFECLQEYVNKYYNDLISFIKKRLKIEDSIKVDLIENIKSCYIDAISSVLDHLKFDTPTNSSFSGGDGNSSCTNIQDFLENNSEILHH